MVIHHGVRHNPAKPQAKKGILKEAPKEKPETIVTGYADKIAKMSKELKAFYKLNNQREAEKKQKKIQEQLQALHRYLEQCLTGKFGETVKLSHEKNINLFLSRLHNNKALDKNLLKLISKVLSPFSSIEEKASIILGHKPTPKGSSLHIEI
ncbi:hypothetical protein ACFLZV_03950 [Candidatus Margulisiibacteriota bacterium]